MLLALFAYAFVSNVALAVVPHEPVVVWYGPRLGIWVTAVVATAGTVLAAWVDHRLFLPLVQRLAARRARTPGLLKAFSRAPFAIIALSGLTPLPFFPFKAMAFTHGYPLGRYVAAVAAGRLPRYASQNGGRIESHVPQIDQIGLTTSDKFRSKHFARTVERIFIELCAGRQHGFVPA